MSSTTSQDDFRLRWEEFNIITKTIPYYSIERRYVDDARAKQTLTLMKF